MRRAKRLLEGLRIHHLGFGFFWTVTFIVLTGFQEGDLRSGLWYLYTFSEQALLPVAVGTLGLLCALRRRELPHWTAAAASFMLSGAALLYFLVFHFGQGTGAVAMVAGLLMGGASALFFLLWELFYVTEGQQRAIICIPLSAAMSVGLYLLIRLLPLVATVLVAVTVLPLVALLCIQRCLAEIEMDAVPPLAGASVRRAVADLWRPVLCVGILGFSWKLISRVGTAEGGSDTLAVLLGFAAAALVVVALELFLSKGFDILRVYQLLFPMLTVVFLLPSLFGQQYTAVLVAFLMFGFEAMNLLLIITCAVYTVQKGLPSSPLYALCIAPVLASMVAGSGVGAALGPVLSNDVAHWANVILFCVMLLSVALVLVTRGKGLVPASVTDEELLDGRRPNGRRRNARTSPGGAGAGGMRATAGAGEGEGAGAEVDKAAPAVAAQRRVVRDYLSERGLSPRETEVAELLMKGHGVSAIASKLFISENTTRGHAKSIYKKLGIHSRQELVDLGDRLAG